MTAIIVVALSLVVGLQGDMSRATGFPVVCTELTSQGLPASAQGGADYERQRILLSPSTCHGFREEPVARVASLLTLGHERAHLLGVRDEAKADCASLAFLPTLARRMGMPYKQSALRRFIKDSPMEECR